MIDAEMALRNGFTLDAIARLPEMGCPDCLSVETPYYYANEMACVLQEHQDLCPRWAVASEHDAIELDQLYADEERGGVWTGEDLIKARMADPYLFLKKAKAAL